MLDIQKNICTKCEDGLYPKENDTLNEYLNCYKDVKGYYLDKNNSLFKKCYYTCETCIIKGDNTNHNCLKCNSNYSFSINTSNYLNCYENCSFYYYFDKDNNYFCTINSSCPEEYPLLIEEKNECISRMRNQSVNGSITIDIYTSIIKEYLSTQIIKDLSTQIIKEEYSTTKLNKETITENFIKKNEIKNIIQDLLNKENQTELKKEEEINYYDTILKDIDKIFLSDNFDTTDIDNGKDEIIETKKMTITFTTTENQKNNKNDNMTSIDLGDCELSLRKYYNISKNEVLYMKK